jgi:hypothetical protein
MNREKACAILDLPLYFDESMLRKKYKIACLKYHPDRQVGKTEGTMQRLRQSPKVHVKAQPDQKQAQRNANRASHGQN